MTETPQLTYCIEEVEDILLLCYANYFGRYKQKEFPVFVEISNNALLERCLTHLEFAQFEKGKKFRVCFRGENKRRVSATFEMQGAKKVYRNRFVNLKKWQTLNDLTGEGEPEPSVDALLATRERNLRVLTIANLFRVANNIPSVNEIHQALKVYMELRNRPFGKECHLVHLK
ncbi:hypothetical protein Zmor_002724 [Zophobas morio]|uniref:Uncharacterized protein n=1 Tax=Zophobas morio TaxID=2755281 RepID=A0AA38HMP4_9CUCU|nr:hypothetical protein Zmor_002724 [Zophobas morio]